MEQKYMTILKVADAIPYDAGRGIARIDPEIQYDLGLQTGDVIGIEHCKLTANLIWPGYPMDSNSGLIRIDRLTRRNAGVGIDEMVVIRKMQYAPAQKIIFSPIQPFKIQQGGDTYLTHNLEGRAITIGDIVELNVMGKRCNIVVVSVEPATDSVIIDSTTKIEFSYAKEDSHEDRNFGLVIVKDIGLKKKMYEIKFTCEICGNSDIAKLKNNIKIPIHGPILIDEILARAANINKIKIDNIEYDTCNDCYVKLTSKKEECKENLKKFIDSLKR